MPTAVARVLALVLVFTACRQEPSAAAPQESAPAIRLPPEGGVVWDWQIGASSDAEVQVPAGVTLLDLDGFTTSARKVAELRAAGVYTVCYMNVGSYEPGRPDSARYPEALKLQADPDWPGEFFLDVADVFRPGSVLADILVDRLEVCRQKGFDALEPDNLQNDENVTGGRVTPQQQLDFNGWIADRAHEHGLAVFQKNGPDKVLGRDRSGRTMVEGFDGILNEECAQYDECAPLAEYTRRGKPALNVEYAAEPLNCTLFRPYGIRAIRKDPGLVGKTRPGYLRGSCD